MALDFSSQSRRASYVERGHDLCETPPVAVQTLLRVERLQGGFVTIASTPAGTFVSARKCRFQISG
jgi:hypothetical protein